MSPIGLNSLETRIKVLNPNCYNFKILSVQAENFSIFYNCAYLEKFF